MFDNDGCSIKIYAKMVGNLDSNIGKVLDALEAGGLADNRIVVFTSDDGGERFGNAWLLIGIKTELLEGGLRVPLIIRWPGKIAPARRVSR